MIDLKKWDALALAATPGPWNVMPMRKGGEGFGISADGHGMDHIAPATDDCGYQGPIKSKANASFIAATNPKAVRELIALVRRQEAELAEARQALDGAVEINNGYLREIDALKAEHLATHRKLAGETLRADQGWTRYEEANADRNGLRTERAAKAQVAPDERKPAFSMFASMEDFREALTDWEQNQHDAQERVAFQASVLKRNADYADPSMLLERNAAGSYAVVRIQGEWEGWQARASLAPQAAAAPDAPEIDLTGINIPKGDARGNVLEQLYAAFHREPAGDTLHAIGSAIQELQARIGQPMELRIVQAANEHLTTMDYIWQGDIEQIMAFAGTVALAAAQLKVTIATLSDEQIEAAWSTTVGTSVSNWPAVVEFVHKIVYAAAAQPEAKEAPAALSDEQIERLAEAAFREGRLSWTGFKEDAEGKFMVPVLSRMHFDLFRVALAAAGNSQDAKDAEEQAQGEGWLRAMSDISALLPGVYYMDPPDGGSVPVLEQVRRMAKDAARYRWLRNPAQDVALVLDKRTKFAPEDESVLGVGGYHIYEYRAGDELDSAIDAAMAAPSPAEVP